MSFSIESIGLVTVNPAEYRDPTLVNQYLSNMYVLKKVLDRAQTPSYVTTTADYDAVIAAVQNLTVLAKDGIVNGSGASTFVSYLNADMAQDLDNVMRTLNVVGLPPPPSIALSDTEKVQLIKEWQSLSGFGFNTIINSAISRVDTFTTVDPTTHQVIVVHPSSGRTLQSMLELEYIRTSNDMLTTNLNSLQSALDITGGIVDVLTSLQNLANQQSVTTKNPFVMPTATDLATFKKLYSAAASAYFTQLFPQANLLGSAAGQLYGLKLALGSKLALLPSGAYAAAAPAGTLANSIYKVLKDISDQFVATSQMVPNPNFANLYQTNLPLFNQYYSLSAYNWVSDGQTTAITTSGAQGKMGAIQGNLAAAISNTENLNETQRDDVRRYLYIFQEFYKSASTMLQLITDAIQKMGKNINKQ